MRRLRSISDSAADDHFHEYLVASLVDILTDLSIRKIRTFLCWCALLAKGASIRDFGNPTAEVVGESIGQNDSGGGITTQSPPSKKRPHESSGVRVRRGDNGGGGANQVGMFNRWTLNFFVSMKNLSGFPFGLTDFERSDLLP